MEWSEAEKSEINLAFATGGLLASASRAVELAAARGGMMTTEDLQHALRTVDSWCHEKVSAAVREHISAQGARVAVLEAEVASARRDADRALVARNQESAKVAGLEETCATYKAERDALRAELDALKPSGQVAEDEALIMRELHEGGSDYDQHLAALHRLAAHAQRAEAAQRDAAHWQARVDAAHDELADVAPKDGDLCTKIRFLKANAESWRILADKMRIRWEQECNRADAPSAAGQVLSEHAGKTAGTAPDDAHIHTHVCHLGYEDGIEAMRTTCRQIVAEEFITDGLDRSALHKRIMERMEGAVP